MVAFKLSPFFHTDFAQIWHQQGPIKVTEIQLVTIQLLGISFGHSETIQRIDGPF